jgi:hypothetical protein
MQNLDFFRDMKVEWALIVSKNTGRQEGEKEGDES